MTWDGKSTKAKVVDLNENYNFIVDDFSFEFVWGSKYLFQHPEN
jgi:hypothetical protein